MVDAVPLSRIERLSIPRGQHGAAWPGRIQRGASPVVNHRHAELEANLVLRGSGTYVVGERRVELRAGTLLWLFPAQDHCLVARSADLLMHIAVWAPALVRTAAPELARRPPEEAWCRALPLVRVRALARLLEEVAAAPSIAEADSGLGFLLRRLRRAYDDAPQAQAGDALDPRVAEVAHLLASTAGDAADARGLARRVGLHPDHLARLFQRQLGLTISAYRNRQRLERVIAGLADGGNLLDLALGAGFGSYTHFHRVFRAHLGTSPRDYLRNQRIV